MKLIYVLETWDGSLGPIESTLVMIGTELEPLQQMFKQLVAADADDMPDPHICLFSVQDGQPINADTQVMLSTAQWMFDTHEWSIRHYH